MRFPQYPRWLTLLAGCLYILGSASGTLWGAFSPFIKERLGFSQSVMNYAVTANLVGGGLLAFPVGMFYDKCGPRPTILLSWILFTISLSYYIWETQDTSRSSSMATIFVTGLSGVALGAMFPAAIGPSMSNFPASKGLVGALVSSLFTVSAGLFSQINEWVLKNDITKLWIVLICWLFGVCLFAIIFTNILEEKKPYHRLSFDDDRADDRRHHSSLMGKSINQDEEEEKSLLKAAREEEEADLSLENHVAVEEDIEFLQKQLPNLNSFQILLTVNFWVLSLSFFVFQGVSNLILYEMGDIVISQGGEKKNINFFITTYSITNCVTTLISGFISDRVRYRFHPPGFICIAVMFCGGGCVLLSIWGYKVLLYATMAIAINNGICWSVLPSIVSEMWGFPNFGSNNAVAGLSAALGSYILPNVVAGHFYNKYSKDGGITCFGPECFRETWIICSAFCLAALISSMALYYFSRNTYKLRVAIRNSIRSSRHKSDMK
ncbi:hypothetical protein PROFUN_05368 [Planoprotostelium fungivorum]|uniref:Nodulin-like domain-containing protein n=1 Tax=Planoprotostelium fungivorum TaxID=1890364 RepID=A0A2P6NR60_9EUKA|nr:hypothetical protein PROFUN_05368 [Planoprotostelium fungivorum]